MRIAYPVAPRFTLDSGQPTFGFDVVDGVVWSYAVAGAR
jgi:hypothetical protein